MFTILRMGNVFGFKEPDSVLSLDNNLIHNLCTSALKKKKIILKNSQVQRTFIPSQVFIQVIDLIIKKNFFNNSIENILFKNFTLIEIAKIIQKRLKILFNLKIQIKTKKNHYKKKFNISPNQNFKFNANNKKIYFEIDRILKYINKSN